MKKAIFAGLLGLLSAMKSDYSIAQVVIAGNYYDETVYNQCGGGGCGIYFSPTPAGQFVTVTNVGCQYQGASQLLFSYMAIATTVGGQLGGRTLPLPVLPVVYALGRYYLNFNIPVSFKIGPSRVPYILLRNNGTDVSFATCNFSGTLSSQ